MGIVVGYGFNSAAKKHECIVPVKQVKLAQEKKVISRDAKAVRSLRKACFDMLSN